MTRSKLPNLVELLDVQLPAVTTKPVSEARPTADQLSSSAGLDRFRAYVDAVPAKAVGQRHATLVALARKGGDLGVDVESTLKVIRSWNQRNATPTPDAEVERTVHDCHTSRERPFGCDLIEEPAKLTAPVTKEPVRDDLLIEQNGSRVPLGEADPNEEIKFAGQTWRLVAESGWQRLVSIDETLSRTVVRARTNVHDEVVTSLPQGTQIEYRASGCLPPTASTVGLGLPSHVCSTPRKWKGIQDAPARVAARCSAVSARSQKCESLSKERLHFCDPAAAPKTTVSAQLRGAGYPIQVVFVAHGARLTQAVNLARDYPDGADVFVVSPTGSGKTQLFTLVASNATSALFLAATVALTTGACHRAGLASYQEGEWDALKLGCCLPSVRQVPVVERDVVCLDEADGALASFYVPYLHDGEGWLSLQQSLACLAHSKYALFLGADITLEHIFFYADALRLYRRERGLAPKPVVLVVQPTTPKRIRWRIVARAQLLAELEAELQTNEKLWFVSDTRLRPEYEAGYARFKHEKSSIHLSGENSRTIEVQSYLFHPSRLVDEHDVAAVNSALGPGCDVTKPVHRVYADFTGLSAPPATLVQLLGRTRAVTSGEVVMCVDRRTGARPTLPAEIEDEVRSVALKIRRKLNAVSTDSKLHQVVQDAPFGKAPFDDLYRDGYLLAKTIEHRERNDVLAAIVERGIAHGAEVVFDKTVPEPEVCEQVEARREEADELTDAARLQRVQSARSLSDDEAFRLQESVAPISEADQYALENHQFLRAYGLAGWPASEDASDEVASLFLHDRRTKFRQRIRRAVEVDLYLAGALDGILVPDAKAARPHTDDAQVPDHQRSFLRAKFYGDLLRALFPGTKTLTALGGRTVTLPRVVRALHRHFTDEAQREMARLFRPRYDLDRLHKTGTKLVKGILRDLGAEFDEGEWRTWQGKRYRLCEIDFDLVDKWSNAIREGADRRAALLADELAASAQALAAKNRREKDSA